MKPPVFYIASKTVHAARWRALRQQRVQINSTWIDEAGEGETADYAELADRSIKEAMAADVLVLYCEPGEILRGALIEVGAALGAGKQIRCIGTCISISRVFKKHPNWSDLSSLEEAFK